MVWLLVGAAALIAWGLHSDATTTGDAGHTNRPADASVRSGLTEGQSTVKQWIVSHYSNVEFVRWGEPVVLKGNKNSLYSDAGSQPLPEGTALVPVEYQVSFAGVTAKRHDVFIVTARGILAEEFGKLHHQFIGYSDDQKTAIENATGVTFQPVIYVQAMLHSINTRLAA